VAFGKRGASANGKPAATQQATSHPPHGIPIHTAWTKQKFTSETAHAMSKPHHGVRHKEKIGVGRNLSLDDACGGGLRVGLVLGDVEQVGAMERFCRLECSTTQNGRACGQVGLSSQT